MLDVVFIVPFDMDVAGAAWATVLAQAISAALCIVFALKRFTILHLSAREWRFSAETAWRHLKVGFPMGFQMSVMCIGQLAMQAAVNRIGTSAIAGYTAANKVDQLSVLVDNAVGIGIANYVAQNYGAGKMDRIKKGVWHCFLMLTAMNFAMGALLLLGQSFVVPMFVTNPTAEIMQYSKDYLFTVVPFYFFLGALLVYRTAIQSVGNTWAPFAACVIELAARILCASVLSVPFGYRAVCFATPFAWLTALSLLIPVYIVLIRKLDGGQAPKQKTEQEVSMQKAILVGVNLNENLDFDHSMEELENLAEACEIEAAAQVVQNLPMVNNAFYIGTGKVEEVKNLVSMLDADCVIFDNSLTPSQQRNLQNQLEVPVWDRTNLILEIFDRRARTKEARLQVESANLQYLLPRLVGMRDALSRQGGRRRSGRRCRCRRWSFQQGCR